MSPLRRRIELALVNVLGVAGGLAVGALLTWWGLQHVTPAEVHGAFIVFGVILMAM
jgi:hypothetical protein